MYLIIKDQQLLGYTYEKLALAAFMQVCKKHGVEITYKECSDDLPMKNKLVKTREHIKNLVDWYSRQPDHTCFYHHYVRLNTNVITTISLEFKRELHKAYYELFLKDLTENLCDCLDDCQHKPTYQHNGPGWFNGIPFSARAKHSQRFHESMRRRYGMK